MINSEKIHEEQERKKRGKKISKLPEDLCEPCFKFQWQCRIAAVGKAESASVYSCTLLPGRHLFSEDVPCLSKFNYGRYEKFTRPWVRL
jgi:hypothetical protein